MLVPPTKRGNERSRNHMTCSLQCVQGNEGVNLLQGLYAFALCDVCLIYIIKHIQVTVHIYNKQVTGVTIEMCYSIHHLYFFSFDANPFLACFEISGIPFHAISGSHNAIAHCVCCLKSVCTGYSQWRKLTLISQNAFCQKYQAIIK